MAIRFLKSLGFFFVVCLCGLNLWAEETVVSDVQIRVKGDFTISDEVMRSRIKVRPGMPFLQELNDESIRALYGTGLFDYIEVTTENGLREGGLDVVYTLYPKKVVNCCQFEGNRALSTRKLRHAVADQSRKTIDYVAIRRDCEKILDLYRTKGYPFAEIATEILDRPDGHVDLLFRVKEGQRLVIGRIKFIGNRSLAAADLRKVMATRRRRLLSFLDGSGHFHPKMMEDDIERLKIFYRNRGFLDVEIDPDQLRFVHRNRHSFDLLIGINEGPRFIVGDVEIEGNRLRSDRELRRLLRIQKGQCFSPARVDETEEAIRYYYGQAGHMETYVTTRRRPDVASGKIHLTFTVHESEKSRVGLIAIQGNMKTKNDVILRELSLIPGDAFNLVKMRNSENRLRETRYFDQVSIVPQSNPLPNYHDVLVTVEEAQTGRFYMGGAISSIDNVVGYVEFSQSNFDIFNRRSRFQGAGQKFRSRFEVGTRSQQAVVSFEEPWLFQRQLGFGADIFCTRNEYKKSDHNYDGASYDEKHRGFEVYLRRRIVELLEGRFYYRLDKARIYNTGPGAPEPLQEDALRGSQWISKVGLNFLRDSRDSLLYPTVGNKFLLDIDFAGLGGDVRYLNLDLQTGQWFKLSNFHTQVLSVVGKIGTVKGFRGKPIPYFDRQFLGGTNDMRGFDFHGVGPKDRLGQPLGANSYAYGCLEYCYKFGEPLRAALFCEGAYMGQKAMHLDSPLYLDAGLELRLFIMGSPLRLIFGYPLKGDDHYDHGLQFNFSFGSMF